MVVKTPVDGVISEDALKFSQQHGIIEYVEKAMQAAREVFADAERITTALKQDPEFGAWYVEIHVVLHDNVQPETEPEMYYECLGKWTPFVPPQLGGLIRVSTSWAS